MSQEPYYRITTAQSDLDKVLYEQPKASAMIMSAAVAARSSGNRNLEPKVSLLKNSFEFLYRRGFKPAVIAANQWIKQTATSGNKYELDYGGEYMARAYRAVDISIGTLDITVGGHFDGPGAGMGFAYCRNFVFHLMEKISFKVSSDSLYDITGEGMFAYYSMVSPAALRPALLRAIRETVYELKWNPGATYDATGATLTQMSSFYAHFATEPIQAYMKEHKAFTVYVPLNFFTLFNVTSPYPEVAVYSLPRYIEFQDRALERCINLYATDEALPAVSGFIPPAFTSTPVADYTWAAVPAITSSRLYVEHIVMHKDLQPMLATTSHAFLLRQFYKDTETLSDKNMREIAVTKVVETLYLIGRHYYNTTHTEIAPPVPVGGINSVYEIDPFSMPTDERPINNITVSARGQTFYKELTWDEISCVWPYLLGHSGNSTTENHCIGVVTFASFYNWEEQQTGSYDSGFGPNLRVTWTEALPFTTADPGILDQIVQSYNVGMAYRGAFSIRYT